jgi:hypothetical protein
MAAGVSTAVPTPPVTQGLRRYQHSTFYRRYHDEPIEP